MKTFYTILLCVFAFSIHGQTCNISSNVNPISSEMAGHGVGQTFTPCNSGKLKSISLYNGNAGSYYLLIKRGSTVLASTSYFSTDNDDWEVLDLTPYNIDIVAGQSHSFQVLGSVNIRVSKHNRNYYGGGHMFGHGSTADDVDFQMSINIAPSFTSYSPADGATNIDRLGQNFAMKFSTTSIQGGSGDILINDGGTTIATVPAASLSISGDSANFSIPSILPQNKTLEIIVPNGAVKGNNGMEVNGFSTWNVTTVNTAVPMAIIGTLPVTGKENVARSENIVINFTNDVLTGSISGKLEVRGSQTGIISGTITGEGTNQITFDPTNDFLPNEIITVTLFDGIENTSNETSINNYTSHFTTVSGVSGAYFVESDLALNITNVRELASADLDGDGDIDLASSAINGNRVDWYENTGSGNFTTHSLDAAFTRAHSVITTDLDSDGDIDIVAAAHNGGKELAWFENTGNGTFSAKQNISSNVDAMYKVEAADIDADGDIDLMTAQNVGAYAAYIRLYINDGNQSFSDVLLNTGQTRNVYTTVADMNQDGKIDILYGSDMIGGSYRQIGYFKNNGDGTFSKVTVATEDKQMFAITPADLDNDGDMDIIGGAHGAGQVIWYRNDNGAFTKVTLASGVGYTFSLKTGDVDGDNDIDIVIASYSQNKIQLFENDGNNQFELKQIGGTLAGPRSVALADFNGDGDLDVAASGLADNKIILLDNQTNTPPTVDNPLADVNVDEGAGTQQIIVNINNVFSDAEGHTLTYTVSSSDPEVTPSFNASTLNVSASADYFGTATITVTANDGHDTTDNSFDFIVAAVNDKPQLTLSHSVVTFTKGIAASQSITSSVSQPTNESDQTLTYSISPDPTTINFATITFDNNTGQVDFSTLNDHTGIQQFEIIVNDGQAENNLDTAYLTLEVNNGILGDWPFDGNGHDMSGNGNNLTNNGGALISDRFGVSNHAYDMGTGRRLAANVSGYSALAQTDQMTISMWIRPDNDLNANSSTQVLMEYSALFNCFYSAGSLIFRINDQNTTLHQYSYATDITGGQWHHIAVTVPVSGNVAFHIDNTRIDVSAAPGSIKSINSQTLVFASGVAFGPTLEFRGDIDDYKIYNLGLSDTEIGDLYNATAPLHLQSVTPQASAVLIQRDADISFNFSESMTLTGVADNFSVRGNYSGKIEGTLSGDGTNSIVFNPNNDFKPNETITVSLKGNVVSSDGDSKPVSYQTQFQTATESNNPIFLETDVVSGLNDPRKIFAADMDNDGDIDLVSAAIAGNSVSWHENNGNGVFTSHTVDNTFTRAHTAEAVDLDNDGDMDIVAATHNGLNQVAWYENLGSGTFSSKNVISSNVKGMYKIHAADLENDGDIDLMTVQADGSESRSHRVTRYINDGNQNFTQLDVHSSSFLLSYVTTADIDKDLDIDIVFTSISQGSHSPIGWLGNNKNNGSYSTHLMGSQSQKYYTVEPTDLDNDGDIDFLVASTHTGEIRWFQNDGSQGFTSSTLVNYAGNVTHSVRAGDINGDGHMDFVGLDYGNSKAYWYENDGSQSFTEHELDASINNPIDIALADTDNDGDLDIMISDLNGDKIVHYENAADEPPVVVAPITDQQNDEDSGAQTIVQDINTVFSSIFTLSYSVSSDVTEVSVSIEGDSLVVTPDPDYNGAAIITLTATDNQSRTAADEFTYTVNAMNDAPVVVNPISDQNTNEDAVLSFQFDETVFNDIDAGDNLTYSALLSDDTSLPTWLSFDANTRTFTGTPTNDEVGTLTIKVTATDNANESVSDEFELEVINTNDAPVLVNAIADQNINEDAALNFQFDETTFNDVDAGDNLTYSALLSDDTALPAWLSFDANNRIFNGTPSNDEVGEIIIKITATDNASATATDEFTLEVINTNDAPTLVNAIADQTVNEDDNFNFQLDEATFNDVDLNDNLTYTATLTDDSALPNWLSFDANTRTFTGVPTNDFVGTISIKVLATDIANESISDEFDLEVVNTNDAPIVVNPIGNQDINEDAGVTTVFNSLNDVFADIDLGDELTFTISSDNNEVTPSISGNDINVEASGNYFGIANISIIASDLSTASVTETFELTIEAVNDAPVISLDKTEITLVKDFVTIETVSIASLSQPDNESDQTITYSISPASVAFANVSIDENTGLVSITAVPDGFGNQVFEVIANDGQNENNTGSASFTLDIIVNPPPTVDNPIADFSVNEDELNFIISNLNTIFSDPEAENLMFTANSDNNNVTVSINGNELIVSAQEDYHGTALITVNATDGISTVTDEFSITIDPMNDNPKLVNPIADINTNEDAVFNFTFDENTFSDIDIVDGDIISYSASLENENTLPEWLSFDSNTRTFSGVPFNENVGVISIQLTAIDNGGLSISDVFDIEVINTNDAPQVENGISNQSIIEDENLNFVFNENAFIDVDAGDVLSYTVSLTDGSELPEWLNFTAGSRTFSGTPLNEHVGEIIIRVKATDTSNEFVTTDFTLEVINSNDGPTVSNAIQNQSVLEDDVFNFTFNENTFSDVDNGDGLSYAASKENDDDLPSWLSFDPISRMFTGTPLNEDVGLLNIKVTATDGSGEKVSDAFELEIINTNDAPLVVNSIPNQNTHEGATFSFQFSNETFDDVDLNDALTYAAKLENGEDLPFWLSFNASTRTFSGNPTFDDVATLSISVTATDNSDATVSTAFEIEIVDALTGLDDISQLSNFLSFYPNPVNDILNINFIQNINEYTLRVVDSQGKIVFISNNNNINNHKIDMRSMARGIYIVELVTKSENFRFRIMKN